jgi:general secretion pathway protein D
MRITGNRTQALRIALGMLLLCGCWAVVQTASAQQGGGAGLTGGTGTRDYLNSTMVGDAMITSDPETRQIIVITDDETNLHISQVITNLDQPKPQVLIKVVFVEVTHRKGLDLGVEASYIHEISSTKTGVAESLFGLAAQTDGGFYRILGDDLNVTLRALAEAGRTEILSRPSILARNSQQATIIVGQELPFITNSRITDQGQTINTVQYSDIGIILRVTPFITSDGMVEMIIAPEISTLTDQTVPISDTVNAPVIAKRAADTVVLTPDGSTVVIGGLMETKKTSTERKIPILGDIPLLGALFKRQITDDEKTELLIFLTPHVVPYPRELARVTHDEARKAVLAPGAFTDEEQHRYLDGFKLSNPDLPDLQGLQPPP